jgi:hypothetical protein
LVEGLHTGRAFILHKVTDLSIHAAQQLPVIPTDEERMIFRKAWRVFGFDLKKEK